MVKSVSKNKVRRKYSKMKRSNRTKRQTSKTKRRNRRSTKRSINRSTKRSTKRSTIRRRTNKRRTNKRRTNRRKKSFKKLSGGMLKGAKAWAKGFGEADGEVDQAERVARLMAAMEEEDDEEERETLRKMLGKAYSEARTYGEEKMASVRRAKEQLHERMVPKSTYNPEAAAAAAEPEPAPPPFPASSPASSPASAPAPAPAPAPASALDPAELSEGAAIDGITDEQLTKIAEQQAAQERSTKESASTLQKQEEALQKLTIVHGLEGSEDEEQAGSRKEAIKSWGEAISFESRGELNNALEVYERIIAIEPEELHDSLQDSFKYIRDIVSGKIFNLHKRIKAQKEEVQREGDEAELLAEMKRQLAEAEKKKKAEDAMAEEMRQNQVIYNELMDGLVNLAGANIEDVEDGAAAADYGGNSLWVKGEISPAEGDPDIGFVKDWDELDPAQQKAAALLGGSEGDWPPKSGWPAKLVPAQQKAAEALSIDASAWPPKKPPLYLYMPLKDLDGTAVSDAKVRVSPQGSPHGHGLMVISVHERGSNQLSLPDPVLTRKEYAVTPIYCLNYTASVSPPQSVMIKPGWGTGSQKDITTDDGHPATIVVPPNVSPGQQIMIRARLKHPVPVHEFYRRPNVLDMMRRNVTKGIGGSVYDIGLAGFTLLVNQGPGEVGEEEKDLPRGGPRVTVFKGIRRLEIIKQEEASKVTMFGATMMSRFLPSTFVAIDSNGEEKTICLSKDALDTQKWTDEWDHHWFIRIRRKIVVKHERQKLILSKVVGDVVCLPEEMRPDEKDTEYLIRCPSSPKAKCFVFAHPPPEIREKLMDKYIYIGKMNESLRHDRNIDRNMAQSIQDWIGQGKTEVNGYKEYASNLGVPDDDLQQIDTAEDKRKVTFDLCLRHVQGRDMDQFIQDWTGRQRKTEVNGYEQYALNLGAPFDAVQRIQIVDNKREVTLNLCLQMYDSVPGLGYVEEISHDVLAALHRKTPKEVTKNIFKVRLYGDPINVIRDMDLMKYGYENKPEYAYKRDWWICSPENIYGSPLPENDPLLGATVGCNRRERHVDSPSFPPPEAFS